MLGRGGRLSRREESQVIPEGSLEIKADFIKGKAPKEGERTDNK